MKSTLTFFETQVPYHYFPNGVFEKMTAKWKNEVFMSNVKTMLYYKNGNLIRACLSALRGSLGVDLQSDESDVRKNFNRGGNSQFEELTYEEWIRALWDNLPSCVKIRAPSSDGDTFLTFERFEMFEQTVRHKVMPNMNQSISHLVLKTAWEGENMDEKGNWIHSELQRALQLDSYYATMVRGSCVKVPLTPDIWCAHNEMEHTGEETTHFFQVMWKASIFTVILF